MIPLCLAFFAIVRCALGMPPYAAVCSKPVVARRSKYGQRDELYVVEIRHLG